jgi:hypothetical protein
VAERALQTSNELWAGLAFMLSKQRYHALLIKGMKKAPYERIEIARWAQNSHGYPVKIGFSTDEYICSDKVSLETILQKLLSSSAVGLALGQVRAAQESKVSVGTGTRKGAVKARTDSIANQVTVGDVPGKVIDEPFGAVTVHKVSTAKDVNAVAKRASKMALGQAAGETKRKVAVKSAVKPAAKAAVAKAAQAKPTAKPAGKPAARQAVIPAEKTATKPVARH